MKYFCKKKFKCIKVFSDASFYKYMISVGDELECLGAFGVNSFEFKTKDGNLIVLSTKDIEEYLSEAFENEWCEDELDARDRFSNLIDKVIKIESEIALLREEIEDVLQELE